MKNKISNKIILSLLGATLLLFSSCEEKAFNFVLNIDDTYEFDVFDDGVFSVATEISQSAILEDIEIESDAEIEDVNIESFAVRVTTLNGNAAEGVSLNGYIYPNGDINETPIPVFENLVVNGNEASDFISIDQLNNAGINAFASKLLGYINETDIEDFAFQLNGTSLPSGSNIAATVELKMRATVKFKENLEVPFFMGDE